MSEDKDVVVDKELEVTKENGVYSILLDSAYPLLKKFREECPGTYKHCQALASMVEGMSLDLELDVKCMKVAALYHDIGKSFNPKFFSENQLEDEDAHADLDPFVSYNIITRHVSDSIIILLNDPNFPREIIEIISQHHGDMIQQYFLNKSDEKDENKFRYKCSRPKSVKSAILMICDQIEAKSKSLIQANKFDPKEVIDGTISHLIDDGQLDNVVMRLGDLKKIKIALAKELEGTYQKRVDYDEADKETKDLVNGEGNGK
ncbi:MAG: hypothetical protein DRO67_08150 [Candidatus Asgardarchaeum californiense]|nr:MAG: hypothetical protein DRO67_08150 [Candidatus Asgardarchaeum californiense]